MCEQVRRTLAAAGWAGVRSWILRCVMLGRVGWVAGAMQCIKGSVIYGIGCMLFILGETLGLTE